MNINLSDLDSIVLSHGHSDHVGGLKNLDLSKQTLYSSEKVFLPKYLKILGFNKYVGIPKSIDKTRFRFVSKIKEIHPDVFIIPLKKTDKTTSNLYKSYNNSVVLDDFSDEIALVLQDNQDLTIFTGCSHHGIVDIIKSVQLRFPNKRIKNVVGGFHMIGVPYINNLGMEKAEVQKIGNELNNLNVEKFYTCHCTGLKAFKLLKPILKEKLAYLSTGEFFVID